MEKILLVQVEPSVERQIRRLAENKKIHVLTAGAECAKKTVDEMFQKDGGLKDCAKENNELISRSGLMLCSDVSEKHFDKLLFEMRSKKIMVDLKAVVTPTNRHWTIRQLYEELEKEKRQFTC